MIDLTWEYKAPFQRRQIPLSRGGLKLADTVSRVATGPLQQAYAFVTGIQKSKLGGYFLRYRTARALPCTNYAMECME